MTIIYRISSNGYSKRKLPNINNADCLANAWNIFKDCNWHFIVDNLSQEDPAWFQVHYLEGLDNVSVDYVNKGSGAQTFNVALDYTLTLSSDEIVYFLENDYLHLPGSKEILEEGLELGADYISLYDHPDKYLNPEQGGNPEVEGGGELTRVLLSKSTHWKITNSTTMTFSAKSQTIREDEQILREFTKGTYPRDFELFLALRDKGKVLVSSLPGRSTHGEEKWLSPLISWEKIC